MDFDIAPDAAGTVSGVITLNYEDASGNPQTVSRTFPSAPREMSTDDFYDPDGWRRPARADRYAGVGVGAHRRMRRSSRCVVIIVVVVRKRKKAKALAALEAEDSDEDL